MVNQQRFELNLDELTTLKITLRLFVLNEIEDIHPDRKVDENFLAISTLDKLSQEKSNFSLENLRIMGVSIFYFQSIADEDPDISADKDTEKYLKISSSILDKIERILNTKDLSLYPV